MWSKFNEDKPLKMTGVEAAVCRCLLGRSVPYRISRMGYFVPVIFLLLLCLASCSSSRIPKAFQGTWDANDEVCKAQHSDMRLLISPSAVEYWESSGDLIKVIESTDTSLIARFTFSGEGESWESEITYLLSNKSNKLVQAVNKELRVSRIRCTDR